MRKGILLLIVIPVLASFFAFQAVAEIVVQPKLPISSAPASVIKPLPASVLPWTIVIETLQAWKRADGQYRYTVIYRNAGTTGFGDDGLSIHHYQLVGSTWVLIGGDGVIPLAPGAAYERLNIPFTNRGATQFKSVMAYNGKILSEKIVPIQLGEPVQASPGVIANRVVAQGLILENFYPNLDENMNPRFTLVVRNNTSQSYTKANGYIFLNLDGDKSGTWQTLSQFYLEDLAPGGYRNIVNAPFLDLGNYQLRATVVYDRAFYASLTRPIDGTAERDRRAQLIATAITVQSLDAWRRADGSAAFSLSVKNNTPYAFLISMGKIDYQTLGLVGGTWVPSGAWAFEQIAANGTAQVVNRTYTAPQATRLAVEISYKGRLIMRKETAVR